jgi:hypothetical protein
VIQKVHTAANILQCPAADALPQPGDSGVNVAIPSPLRGPVPTRTRRRTSLGRSRVNCWATEIRWYIDGLLAESTPLDCDLESAKKIGIDLADRRIPMDDRWQQAEKKDQESSRHQRRGRPICVDVLICRVQLMCSGFQSPSPSEAVSRLIVLTRSEIQTMDFMKA